MEYTVIWRVQLDAASPREAARLAKAMQLDIDSTANVFEVGTHPDLDIAQAPEIDLDVVAKDNLGDFDNLEEQRLAGDEGQGLQINTINLFGELEGWAIFETNRGLEIQRYQEVSLYNSDHDARFHVREMARFGSVLHKQALEIVSR